MNEKLGELYVHFSVIFSEIEREEKIKFFAKKSFFSFFIEMKELLKTEKNEFVEKLVQVYEKYGVEIFKNSLISYACIIQIHKYLAKNGIEAKENSNFVLDKKEIIDAYETSITIDELIENNQVIGHKEINPYAKMIPSKHTNTSYIIDVDDNLYYFGGVSGGRTVKTTKIIENVKLINTDFGYLVGINSEGKLWFETALNPHEKILFFDDNELKFVKLATELTDDRGRILLALSECGGLYQFYRSTKGFSLDAKIQGNVVDISGYDDVFAYVLKNGKMHVRGNLEKVCIINSKSDFVSPYFGNVKRVFVHDGLLFVINDDGYVFAIGRSYHYLAGTGKQKQSIFSQVQIQDKIVDISISKTHTLFLSVEGRVYGCGQNNSGQLGGHGNKSNPTLITSCTTLIMAGQECSFMINETANAKALGDNTDGRFGVITSMVHSSIYFIDLLDDIF